LLPIQLLWINLVTDGLPALALSLEPPEPGIMRRRPRPAKEPILSLHTGFTILWQGIVVGAVALVAFAAIYVLHPEEVGRARTMAFCVLVYGELLRALAARSQRLTLLQLGLLSNPALLAAVAVSALLQLSLVTLPYARPVFETVSHFGWEWGLMLGLALVPISLIEVQKLITSRWPRTNNAADARADRTSVARS
jgi:Ca2+-transporting ATPase